jgi:hypothetical protein
MGVINYTDRIKYTGAGYLDSKMAPVKLVEDLYKLPLTQRFEGLTITVLNNGDAKDYWLVGGISNNNWIEKNDNESLKLILEDGFLKLLSNDKQIGDGVDLNNFFPESDYNDLHISNIEYVTENDKQEKGIFICFTYSDNSAKYLNMSQFLQQTYEPGNGIVVNGNVISIDDVIIGRIETIEQEISTQKASIDDIKTRLQNVSKIVDSNKNLIDNHSQLIEKNIENILKLTERIDNIDVTSVNPDNLTISLTEDTNNLQVKLSKKNNNMLSIEDGLYASIPIYCEDNEINI